LILQPLLSLLIQANIAFIICISPSPFISLHKSATILAVYP
jgi:hypothetical protein